MVDRALRISPVLLILVAACPEPPEPPPEPKGCELPAVPPPQIDPAATKFTMNLFHFNLQYVVGGLEGNGEDIGPFCGEPCAGWDNDAVEDWIVRETFAPVVQFYLEHPQWKATFEMQGYMLEVLAARFPKVLDDLRTLAGRGQVEIASLHYSDQLFLAYPRRDLARSTRLTRQVFEEHCVPLSGVVFNQEGQAGEGWMRYLTEEGYEIGVFPKNLFKYVRGDAALQTKAPWYAAEGGTMIVGPGGVDPASGIEVAWSFFDDGELLMVDADLNPYFAPFAGFSEARYDAWEKKLQDLEDAGYRSVTITEYVRHLEARGQPKPDAPPLLDGTWQPGSTESIHRWLGGMGQGPWSGSERDTAVRSGNYEARHWLEALEIYVRHAKSQKVDVEDDEAYLERAWKDLTLAMVSDSTGVNPWAMETRFSLDLNAAILQESKRRIDALKQRLGDPYVAIDLDGGTVERLTELPGGTFPETIPPLSIETIAPGRDVGVTWLEVGPGHTRLKVHFGAGATDNARLLEVRLPREDDVLRYVPGLIENEVTIRPLSDFVFEKGEAWLPLPSGLIGLGPDLWMVKHVRTNHVAARIAPADPFVAFRDETAPADEEVTWIFDVLRGSEADALALARSLNLAPTLVR